MSALEQEPIQKESFGFEFRTNRFAHAVRQDLQLKYEYKRYREVSEPYFNPELEQQYEEAKRVAAWGIWCCLIDVLDQGEPEEVEMARKVVTIYQFPELLDKTG